jgi:hypothetical protein
MTQCESPTRSCTRRDVSVAPLRDPSRYRPGRPGLRVHLQKAVAALLVDAFLDGHFEMFVPSTLIAGLADVLGRKKFAAYAAEGGFGGGGISADTYTFGRWVCPIVRRYAIRCVACIETTKHSFRALEI